MLRPQHLISSQVTEEHFCPNGSEYLLFSNLSLLLSIRLLVLSIIPTPKFCFASLKQSLPTLGKFQKLMHHHA
jgi:hypothetical protein